MPSELQERAETGAEIIIPALKEGDLPAPPPGYILVDLGYRIELRAESPDESVPTAGRLVGLAHRIAPPYDLGWVLQLRWWDHKVDLCEGKTNTVAPNHGDRQHL